MGNGAVHRASGDLMDAYNKAVAGGFVDPTKEFSEVRTRLVEYINNNKVGDERTRLLNELEGAGREAFIRALQSPETLNRIRDTKLSRQQETTNRANAIDYVRDLQHYTSKLVNFSAWDNLIAFTELGDKIKDTLTSLAKGQYSTYVNGELKEVLDAQIVLLQMTGFLTTAQASGGLSNIGTYVSGFVWNVASAMVDLNFIDGNVREFVFEEVGNAKTISDYVFENIVETKDAGIQRAYDFALRAIYGDIGTVARGLSLPLDLGGTQAQQYFALVNWMLANTVTINDWKNTAWNINPEATDILTGTSSLAETVDVLSATSRIVAVPETMKEGGNFRNSRPAYDMLSVIGGLQLLNSGGYFPSIRTAPSLDMQLAIDAFVALKYNYAQMNDLLHRASLGSGSPDGIAEGEFKEQFAAAYSGMKEQIDKISNATPYGNGNIQLVYEGLEWFDEGYNAGDAADKAWEFATSENLTEMEIMRKQAILRLDSGIGDLDNTIYGANPAEDLLKNGVAMPRGMMLHLFANRPEELFGEIYPDASAVDLSTRNQITDTILDYMEIVYSTNSTGQRFSKLDGFLAALIETNLNTDSLTSNLVNQTFGITRGGVIYVKGMGILGGEELYARRGRNVWQILESHMGRPFFGPCGLIPAVPTSPLYETQIALQLESAYGRQRAFRDRELTSFEFSRFLMAGLERRYETDITTALAKIASAYDRVADRSAIPLLGEGAASLALAAGSTQRAATGAGGAGEFQQRTGSSYAQLEGNYGEITQEDYGTIQRNLLGEAANYRAYGDFIIRRLLTHASSSSRWQDGTVLGSRVEAVSQSVFADLNSSPYKDSDLLVHFNRTMTRSEITREGVRPEETGRSRDELDVYYRMGGTTWVRLILTDDVRKDIMNYLGGRVPDIDRASNYLMAGGSTDEALHFQRAVQVRKRDYDDIKRTDIGYFVGIGHVELKSAIVGGQTTDNEAAMAAAHREHAWETKVGYYQINTDRLRDITTLGAVGVGGYSTTVETVGARDRGDLRNEQIVSGEIAVGTEDIMKLMFSTSVREKENLGEKFAGGRFGYQSADYTKGEGGYLFKSFGFFSWNDDRTLQAANYGSEGDFREIPLAYLAQIRKYANGNLVRYTGALQTEVGDFTLEVSGNLTDPRRFYQSMQNQLLNAEQVRLAHAAYVRVAQDPDSSQDDINGALHNIGQAMNSVFASADSYSLFRQLGNSISDLTFSAGKDNKQEYIVTISSQFDEAGKKTNIVSLIDVGGNFSVIGSFDLRRELETEKIAGVGAGAVYKAEKFKTLFYVSSVPPEVSPHRYIAEWAMAAGDEMVDFTLSGNLWRGQFTHAGRNFQFMINAADIDRFSFIGTKGVLYNNQMRYVLGVGTSLWHDVAKLNINARDVTEYHGEARDVRKMNIEAEIGKVGEVIGGVPGYYGFGVRWEPIIAGTSDNKRDILIYLRYSQAF